MAAPRCFRAAAAAAFLLAGCGGSSNSYIKIIQASPSGTNLDVKIGSSYAAQNLSYGTATGAYAKEPTGTSVNLTVYAATKDTNPLVSGTQSFTSKQYYTVVALNTAANLQVQVINDDLTAPPSGQSKLRIINASPSAGLVDVYITAPGLSLTNSRSPVSPTLANLGFGVVTSYLDIAAGTYEIRVTLAGNPADVLMDTGPSGASYAAGASYTAVALDPDASQNGPYTLFITPDVPVAGVTPTAPV